MITVQIKEIPYNCEWLPAWNAGNIPALSEACRQARLALEGEGAALSGYYEIETLIPRWKSEGRPNVFSFTTSQDDDSATRLDEGISYKQWEITISSEIGGIQINELEPKLIPYSKASSSMPQEYGWMDRDRPW